MRVVLMIDRDVAEKRYENKVGMSSLPSFKNTLGITRSVIPSEVSSRPT